MAPVDQENGHNINSSYIPTIKAYVSSLRPYSSVIYGRINLEQYNFTSSPSLYDEAALYVNQLGLNGIWFDHAPVLYNDSGKDAFNWYMQNLTTAFPQLNYLVDQSANFGTTYVTPLNNDTWGQTTYITPTTNQSTDNALNWGKIEALNAIYPGRVVVHYDAFAGDNMTPMSYFSVQSSSQEISAVSTLVREGAFPSSGNRAFSFIFPIIGAWTDGSSTYNGTLYNSLNSGDGNFPRSTYNNFTSAMISNYVLGPAVTFSPDATPFLIMVAPMLGALWLAFRRNPNSSDGTRKWI